MKRNITRKPPTSVFQTLLDYTADFALNRNLSELARTVELPAAVSPTNVTMVHLQIANIPGQLGKKALLANTDGTLTVTEDILALKITCMAICRFAVADNIILGIGIGDPTTLPTEAGTSTDILPLGTYVSRFRDASKGENLNRSVTLQTPYFPVGKQTTLGAKAGDKVFPVMWTEENDVASVIFDDLIFVAEAVPL